LARPVVLTQNIISVKCFNISTDFLVCDKLATIG